MESVTYSSLNPSNSGTVVELKSGIHLVWSSPKVIVGNRVRKPCWSDITEGIWPFLPPQRYKKDTIKCFTSWQSLLNNSIFNVNIIHSGLQNEFSGKPTVVYLPAWRTVYSELIHECPYLSIVQREGSGSRPLETTCLIQSFKVTFSHKLN